MAASSAPATRRDALFAPGWLPLIAVFAIVVVARSYYVHHFAGVMPFWDQWDAEGYGLIGPWSRGELALSDLWQLHNEHRILPARLVTLLAFIATDVWSNQLVAKFNVVLAATVPALLAYLVFRERPAEPLRLAMLPVLLAGAVLPFGWENTLVGFQSQFYFLIVFTTLALVAAAWRPERRAFQALALALSALCVLTLASGILTPVAVAAVYWASWFVRRRAAPPLALTAALVALAGIGYAGIPQLAGHGAMRAQGVLEFAHAMTHLLGWPLSAYHWTFVWLWLPAPLFVARVVARRSAQPLDLLMLGYALWTLLQAAALAYGRGHGLLEPASRYTDLLVPGLTANAWFAVRLLGTGSRAPARAVAAVASLAFLVAFVHGHASRARDDWRQLQERAALYRLQETNVRRYLATGDAAALQQPHMHIPYPDPVRLRQLLDDPALRAALPQPSQDPAAGDRPTGDRAPAPTR